MSGLFQGYANSDGRVRVSAVTKVPAGVANDRGMIVAGNRVIPYLVDAGQSRHFHDGIAFDSATGLLLLGDGAQTPLNISMGGLLVDSRGAVVPANKVGDVIHQGVGLTNEGALAIESEPIATFIAHLRNNVASTAGPGTFTRASDGLYQGVDGIWRIAPVNVPRFENDQLLMEPASTNVCLNYNAAPDAGQSGMSINGTGTLTRVDRTAELAAAGLSNICPTGLVWRYDSPAGGSVIVNGQIGSLNKSVLGGWCRKVSGTDHARIQDTYGQGQAPFENSDFERIVRSYTPTNAAARWSINHGNGDRVISEFILNSATEEFVATSPIVTQGAAASRAIDSLNYLPAPGFFNEPEGMALATVRFPYDLGPDILNYNAGLVSVSGVGNSVLYCRNDDGINVNLRSYVTDTNTGPSAPVAAGDVWHVANRWFGGQFQTLGFSINGGPWVWDLPYNSPLTWPLNGEVGIAIDNRDPKFLSDVYIYNEDKGQAWIEANYP